MASFDRKSTPKLLVALHVLRVTVVTHPVALGAASHKSHL